MTPLDIGVFIAVMGLGIIVSMAILYLCLCLIYSAQRRGKEERILNDAQ